MKYFITLLFSALVSLSFSQSGCTDSIACNFDAGATIDDGSCVYNDCMGICGGSSIMDACGNCYDPNEIINTVFNYSGSIEYFVVPPGVTQLTIEATGASGGSNGPGNAVGGLGVFAAGDFTVTPGDVLRINVGGAGGNGIGSIAGGGGGGGSFVAIDGPNTPLLIAAGGAGASYNSTSPGEGGRITESGGAGGYSQAAIGQGGISANDGGGGTGGGGGGWLGAGMGNNWIGGGAAEGGAGGAGYSGYGNPGGFGGGGGSMHGGGGGGGYTGGSGGKYTIPGGGGGSYNAGTNTTMTAGFNSGNGVVTIIGMSAPLCFLGCTDPNADNYDSSATDDDGSCFYLGCMDSTACNFDPEATIEDGTCLYNDCAGTCGGTFVMDACGNCYDPEVGESATINFSGDVQYWTVPAGITLITVEANGAEGGNNGPGTAVGGLGARATGDFNVTPGEVLKLIVGGTGGDGVGSIAGGGGGGGTFVLRDADNSLMIIAGGGAGASYNSISPGEGGRTTETGGAGGYSIPGIGQGGITANDGGGGTGAGGGGWLGDGQSNNWCDGGLAEGGAGGAGVYQNQGGFGGGGGSMHGGGGGGGYSGGSGGKYTVPGGGGGSYNSGFSTTMQGGANPGNGFVVISYDGSPACGGDAGCTYSIACNYNPSATDDDGSCLFAGCTDPGAMNYNPNAACDDESCVYQCMGDLNNDGYVNTIDLLDFLAAFGTTCE